MAQKFDPITLEILWARLISIAEEADASIARTAFSTIVRDGNDYSNIICDAEGREICQGPRVTPGQCGALVRGVKKIVNMFPKESFRPGDILISNDPWLLAGHLNDVALLAPIFYKEGLVAFSACVFHHGDIGGRVSADDSEVHEEGLFLPPVKLLNGGLDNTAVFDIIQWNVRQPRLSMGDLRSQISATYIASRGVIEMMEDVGLETLDGLAAEIYKLSEQGMREGIERIPDGIYTAEGKIEAGHKQGATIKVAVEVKESDVVFDFEGSSPQVNWAANSVYNFTFSYCLYAMKTICSPDVPNNEGCAAPIRVKAPEGSVVNAKFPAAVGTRIISGQWVFDVIYRALAPVVPDRVLASSGAIPSWCHIFSGNRATGEEFFNVSIGGAGMGAGKGYDGHSPAHFPTNCSNTPAEIFESDTPLFVESREMVNDSGGVGEYRGGLAYREVYRVPDDVQSPQGPVRAILYHCARFEEGAPGLFGGGEGGRGGYLINRIPKDWGNVEFLKPGDTVEHVHGGGGGHGDPLNRDPELVEKDVFHKYVSLEKARQDYGVVIDAKTLKVDRISTEELRQSLRKARGLHEKK
jgi:N-methylhydantoinase B